ncbi:hypothetical protein J40TS1_36820 [Paenibacillus montaniterrae]|uniref:Transmembrane protein n=2 Tax=Paenibacillus montaniterrae TaxID=429341 RepID=A0A919YRF3_9BACL|nr:hypothetical protein J40TS1_36820 [Paenibacillus montaniterrae]
MNVYMLTLWLVYNERLTELSTVLWWTAPIFFLCGSVWYFICVVFLRAFNKYCFLSQTIMFMLIGLLLVFITPLVVGVGSINLLAYFTSPEAILFMLYYTSTTIICSYGIWLRQSGRRSTVFYLMSAVIVLLFIFLANF